MKTTLTATLSKNSFKNLIDELNTYKSQLQKGIDNGVKKITLQVYELVLNKCNDVNIKNHIGNIKWTYDEEKNIGKVYTNELVIIVNEMGTGIKGKNNSHPNPSEDFASWTYDVNEHGELGWRYPKEDGTFGWTRGLPSKHMFYDAFLEMKDLIPSTIEIEIRKTTGNLY